MPLTDIELAPFAELLGTELTPDNALAVIDAAVHSALDRSDKLTISLSRAEEELATAKAEVISLSRTSTGPAKPSASEIYWANKAVQAARKEVVSGGLNPAVADALEAKFLRSVDTKTISLSREVQDDDHKLASGFAQLLDVYEALKGNVPAPTSGEASGLQNAVALARSTPGAPEQKPDTNELLEAAKRLNPQAA